MKVTRAQQKLIDFVEYTGFDFAGKIVLDIGSSTGGFTEVALERGARKVIAVERGTGQMRAPLRYDSRVELHEKTDVFGFSARAEVIMADVSFVSLRKVLAYARERLAGAGTEFLVMLKPQFEASSRQLHRGVVKNERMRREIIRDFEIWLRQNGFIILQKRDNSQHGKHGNVERFYLLRVVRFPSVKRP